MPLSEQDDATAIRDRNLCQGLFSYKLGYIAQLTEQLTLISGPKTGFVVVIVLDLF